MKERVPDNSPFPKEHLEDVLQIWHRSAVSLIDVRHKRLEAGEGRESYVLPASALLYTSGGRATVELGQRIYEVETHGIFHGGKGTPLLLHPRMSEPIEAYMVLYKPDKPPYYKTDLLQLLEKVNPFEQIYGFSPENRLLYQDILKQMRQCWLEASPLRLFQAKALLYQLIFRIYEDLGSGRSGQLGPDIATQAIHYIKQHYASGLTIKELRESLHISPTHLNRIVKEKTGESPRDYLMHVRLQAAREHLKSSRATLKEIAQAVGFYDEYHLSHAFKRHFGVTPALYRQNLACGMVNSCIANDSHSRYPESSSASLAVPEEGRSVSMYRNFNQKALLIAALGVVMMLSACGTAAPDSSASAPTPTEASATKNKAADDTVSQFRTVPTIKGDVDVPADPKRVIAHYLMGDIYRLGIDPVGVSEVHKGAAFEELAKGAVDLGQWNFNLEAVLELEPDLIISVNESQYDELSKIAPTVLVPYGSMTTDERLTFLGEILNRQAEAEAVLEAYHQKVAEARRKLEEAGLDQAVLTIMQIHQKGISVSGDMHALGGLMYKELGLKPHPKVQKDIIDAGEYWGQPSMEILDDYVGDYIIHLGDILDTTAQSAVWQNIEAVRKGRIITSSTSVTYYTDIASAEKMLDDIVRELLTLAAEG